MKSNQTVTTVKAFGSGGEQQGSQWDGGAGRDTGPWAVMETWPRHPERSPVDMPPAEGVRGERGEGGRLEVIVGT